MPTAAKLRPVLVFAAVFALLPPGCGAGEAQSEPKSANDELGGDGGPLLAGNDTDAGGAGLDDGEDEDAEDDDADDEGDDDALERRGEPGPLGLRLDVTERGPGMPWVMAIVNEGDEPVRLTADPRLLRFEVVVPGKRRKVTCKLPARLYPDLPEKRLMIRLRPGEGVAQAFDPRLYCFTTGGQDELVPGAIVTPSFGWPEKDPKVVWRKGKKETVAAKQSPPFVAGPVGEEALPLADPPPDKKELDGGAFEEQRVKKLTSEPFALRSEYIKWASTRPEDREARKNPGPFELLMVQGSDAHAERTATVRISLKNRSKRSRKVYFRRELVSFEVMGPDGMVTCDAQPDVRHPDPQAFSRIGAGGRVTVTSRLIELCPQGTFGRPGFYLVHARFDAKVAGEEYDVGAYTGTVVSLRPAGVRIRTGEQPFLKARPMRMFDVREDQPESAADRPEEKTDAGSTEGGK